MTPIFLISLPRSGSTFLQKILMSHPSVASTAEPWFLLPLMHLRNKEGVFARYGHVQAVNAMNRIADDLGGDTIDRLIVEFASGIYSGYARNSEPYFLDKTPRYYFILDELLRVFPEGKFLVLLRSPVSVFASAIEAFRGGRMRRLDHLDNDFNVGPARIGEFLQRHGERTCTVTYESLVEQPGREVERICRYLEIEFNPAMIDASFGIDLKGHGDHLGARVHDRVMPATDKWKSIITTHYRRRRLLAHIQRFPSSYLEAGGYDRHALFEEVKRHRGVSIDAGEYFMAAEEAVARFAKRVIREAYGRRV